MTRISAVDYHTGGEPFRIVTDGIDAPQGATILERRRDAHERLDHVRRLLVYEPRGHADMYGCFVVPPNDPGADLGVVFFHNAGYSTACGHGTIALVTWALDEGIVERREGENHVVVDVPSGRLETWARVEGGRVRSVRFRNVPAFVWAEGLELGDRKVDVAFGGAFYASLEERVGPAELPRLIDLGRELKREIEGWQRRRAPARARASRRLRRDLLAGGGRGSADAAQRHRVRGRRGRPLPVRQRDLGASRVARQVRPAAARRRAAAPEHRRLRVLGACRGRRRTSRASTPSSPTSRGARSGRASTSSSSIPTIRSVRASFSARRASRGSRPSPGSDPRRASRTRAGRRRGRRTAPFHPVSRRPWRRAATRSRPRDSRRVCRIRFRWGSRRSRRSRAVTLPAAPARRSQPSVSTTVFGSVNVSSTERRRRGRRPSSFPRGRRREGGSPSSSSTR